MSLELHPQNTAMRRARFGKEKEVGDAVLEWVRSTKDEVTQTIIRTKAAEIATEMGRDFSPSMGWVSRLCKRGSIELKRGGPKSFSAFLEESMRVQRTTASHDGMEDN